MMYKDKEKYNQWQRDNRAFWKSRHRCTRCHGQDAFTLNGRCLCAVCTEKSYERGRRYRANNIDKIRERVKDRYLNRKSNRQCTRCGKPLSSDDKHITCPCCRAKGRGRYYREKVEMPASHIPDETERC